MALRRLVVLLAATGAVQAQCSAPRESIPADLPPAVAQAVDALYAPQPEPRMAGAWALGELRAPAAVPFLLALLADHGATHERKLHLWQPPDLPYGPILTSPGREAAKALVKCGPSVLPAVRALVARRDTPAGARANACFVLGELRDREAAALLAANTGEIDALLALGKLADPTTVPALLGCIADPWRGYLAARALVAIGQPAVPPLIDTLLDPKAKERRAAAAELLGRMRAPAAIPALTRAVAEPDAALKLNALEALTVHGPAAAGAAGNVVAALADTDWRCRSAAAKALAALGARDHAPALAPLLADPDLTVRGNAARALAGLGHSAALPGLRKLLGDPEPFVRVSALRALATLGDRESGPTALALLDEPDDRVREAAFGALGALGDGAAAQRLVALLRDPDEARRARAVATLAQLGNTAVPALTAALRGAQDNDWTRLNHVAEALGRIGTVEAAAATAPLLTGPNWICEVLAGRALAAMGPPGADALIAAATKGVWRAVGPLLEVKDPRVTDALIAASKGAPAARQTAAEVMGKRKDARCVPTLIGLLSDPDARTASNAQQALTAITGQVFGRDAAQWQAWWAASQAKLLK